MSTATATPELDVDALFGTTNYNKTSTVAYKNLKLSQPDLKKGQSETTLTVKIMPPMHSGRDRNGVNWACRSAIHWGYKVQDAKDPNKEFGKSFVCVEKSYNKVIEQVCEECELIREAKNVMELRRNALKQAGNEKGVDTDPEYQRAAGFTKVHNLDCKYRINVMTLDGEFGVLKVSITTYKALKAFMEGYKAKKGVDINDPNGGAWIKFTTTGQFRDKKDNIEIYMEEIPGSDGAFRAKPGALTHEQKVQALKCLPDIFLPESAVLSPAQVAALTKCSGDPAEVSAIFSGQGQVMAPGAQATANAGGLNVAATEPMTAERFAKEY